MALPLHLRRLEVSDRISAHQVLDFNNNVLGTIEGVSLPGHNSNPHLRLWRVTVAWIGQAPQTFNSKREAFEWFESAYIK